MSPARRQAAGEEGRAGRGKGFGILGTPCQSPCWEDERFLLGEDGGGATTARGQHGCPSHQFVLGGPGGGPNCLSSFCFEARSSYFAPRRQRTAAPSVENVGVWNFSENSRPDPKGSHETPPLSVHRVSPSPTGSRGHQSLVLIPGICRVNQDLPCAIWSQYSPR